MTGMINLWKKYWASMILSVCMLAVVMPLKANAANVQQIPDYSLTDTLTVQVKSVLNEAGYDGVRIGAVVRLYNKGERVERVPDYQLQVRTTDGVSYLLHPSTANASIIQPKEQLELSYMLTVKRMDNITLSKLAWVKWNKSVYPKRAEPVLTVSVSGLEWKGDSYASNSLATKMWGDRFAIPVLSGDLQYKPVYMVRQNTDRGPAALVVLQVENGSMKNQWIPDFVLDAKAYRSIYRGQRVEQGPIMLEPGEKKDIHYAIPMDNGIVLRSLRSLTLLTPERFAEDGQTIDYNIGRLNIEIPADRPVSAAADQPGSYDWGSPIRFNSLNKRIPSDLAVSLDSLQMHEGDGYRAIVARFKLQNNGRSPIALPDFQAELMNDVNNVHYTGTRQTVKVNSLIPNIGYMTEYYFIVPESETGDALTMEILDTTAAAPYQIPIASFHTQLSTAENDGTFSFYPFNIELKGWELQSDVSFVQQNDTMPMSNKLKLNLAIQRRGMVIADQNFSKMEVEMVDKEGNVVGTQSVDFTGENGLVSGYRTIVFHSEVYAAPFTVRIYETIDTIFGTAKRLVKTLQQ